MKKKLLSLLLLVCMCLTAFAGCDFKSIFGKGDDSSTEIVEVDYAGQVTLNMESETLKQEVTVLNYIDGDTTHFNVPNTVVDRGILKARYIAVNTPESTGKIEEWGKKAARFTKSKLAEAESIIIETDGTDWEVDSTGDRHLVWVWYKNEGALGYRNLNIELLQEGLAIGSKAGFTRYGDTCTQAINQAITLKKHVHSSEKDPDYYYGEAVEMDIKEIRLNIEDYVGMKVAFEGVVTYYSNDGVYVEAYDEATDKVYGTYVYYGHFLTSNGKKVFSVGNRVRIVGSVQYYETGKSYQISDLQYDPFDLTNPNNIQKLDDEKHTPYYTETTVEQFHSEVTIDLADESKTFDYAELALGTTVEMKNLVVESMYTTDNDGANDGAISITCKVGEQTITVRTVVLTDADGELITQDYFRGKTIDVKGVIDTYKGAYQVKLFSLDDVVVHQTNAN